MLKHEYADVNGVRLHYVTAGEGKLIMFVHGFPEFWYAWKGQLAEFGHDHQAVAMDTRGYNLSSKPDDVEQYRMPLLVEDLLALADHLGHHTFVLVGHDWGGIIAWAFAAQHPERLEKLVIINSPHPAIFRRQLLQNPEQQKASAYMLFFRTPQAELALSANHYAALVDAVMGEGLKQGYFSEDDRKAYIEAWSQPGALTGGLNYYRAARAGPPAAGEAPASGDFARDLPSLVVRVPTLVIWGEKDAFLLTGNLDGLDTFVPNLTLRRLADGSHWVIHEKPQLVNTLIRDFLSHSSD